MSGFKQVTKAQARHHLTRDERIERLEGTIVPYETRQEYAEEITRLWQDAQRTFLTIGRYLVAAAAKLQHGEYQGLVDNDLPFGYQVSYQLRKVAEAIDGGRLPGERLPPSYATVYQLVTLSEEHLKLADERKLIRPDVKREEIIEFKRELRRTATVQILTPSRLVQLQRRRQYLLTQQQKIRDELAAVEAELEQAAPELS
jgi:hypothetical protein